jgi:hypothetical protein
LDKLPKWYKCLFSEPRTINIQLSLLIYFKADIIIIPSNVTCSRHEIPEFLQTRSFQLKQNLLDTCSSNWTVITTISFACGIRFKTAKCVVIWVDLETLVIFAYNLRYMNIQINICRSSYCNILLIFSRVATKSNSADNMMNGVRASGRRNHFRTISWEWNVWSKWNLVYTCQVVRGGSLLILRIVGQRSMSQLLKIKQTFHTFFVSARYLKKEISDLNKTWYIHAWWWKKEVCRYWSL